MTAETPGVTQCGLYGMAYGLTRNNYSGDSRNAENAGEHRLAINCWKNILLHDKAKKGTDSQGKKKLTRIIFYKQTLVGKSYFAETINRAIFSPTELLNLTV